MLIKYLLPGWKLPFSDTFGYLVVYFQGAENTLVEILEKDGGMKKKLFAISLVIISVIYLLFNFESIPWVGLIVALSWSLYNLIRKKVNVDTDIGLFIESIYILPIALAACYFIYSTGNNDFNFEPIW